MRVNETNHGSRVEENIASGCINHVPRKIELDDGYRGKREHI